MYMCAQICSLQVRRGSACDIRPVWRLRDTQRNCFVNQEVECCKGCSLGGSKRQLAGCHHTHPLAGTSSQDFTYPLSSSSAKADAGTNLLDFLPQGPRPSNYGWNVGAGLWSPHTQQHSAALSTCLQLPAQRKRGDQSHRTAQQRRNGMGEWEDDQHFIIFKDRKQWRVHVTWHITWSTYC